MFSMALWLILGLGGLWAVSNLLAYRNFKNSLPKENNIGRRLVTWAELIYPPMRKLSFSTRSFVGESYTSRAPNGFTLWAVVLVIVAAVICFVAVFAEYGFSQFTLSEFLGETPELATMLFGFPLSSVLAVLIVIIAALAGLILFEKLGAIESPNSINAENPSSIGMAKENDRKTKNFLLILVAFNVLVAIAAFQGFLGFERGNEFILASSFEEQILGNVPTANASNSLTVSLLNSFLGILMPFITAFTARYLLTFLLWILATVVAVLLAIVLWLPTWALNGAIVRYQQQHGAPQFENTLDENENLPPPTGTNRVIEPSGVASNNNVGDVPTDIIGDVTSDDTAAVESERAATERIEEDRQRLSDLEEAERRRREQANSNPFGI